MVLLDRIPREPSSPRIAVWRRLRDVGVGQLGDGAVALPEDARTCEHPKWVADQVLDAGGTALLLRAQACPGPQGGRTIARLMADAAKEYDKLAVRARAALTELGSDPDDVPADATPFDMRRVEYGHNLVPVPGLVVGTAPSRPSCAATSSTTPPWRRRRDRSRVRPGGRPLRRRPRGARPPPEAHPSVSDNAVLRGLSMSQNDDTILALTGPLFDGLHEYFRRGLILGKGAPT